MPRRSESKSPSLASKGDEDVEDKKVEKGKRSKPRAVKSPAKVTKTKTSPKASKAKTSPKGAKVKASPKKAGKGKQKKTDVQAVTGKLEKNMQFRF